MSEVRIIAPPAGGLDEHDFRDDLRAIAGNASIPTMLETVCMATGLRFAAIARVTDARWITCSVADHLGFGLLPGSELVVETTLCHEVRQADVEIVFNDARAPGPYKGHPTAQMYGFRSYLSIPIHWPDGRFFGTLCALDPNPQTLDDPRVLAMTRMFARMIGETLQLDTRLQNAEEELAQEREIADVQEQFMAILAHDLRNPITAVRAGLCMLKRQEADPRKLALIDLMDGSGQRMADLVSNLMDHARNRLGGGIVLDRRSDRPLTEALDQIVAEFRAVAPSSEIVVTFELPPNLDCDRARIAQLLSNLLGNAITHGTPDRPIHVSAKVTKGTFALAVLNEGAPIPESKLSGLFSPFQKGDERPNGSGLGLGLYIASEIAKAHGGRMLVASTDANTVFTFEMPACH